MATPQLIFLGQDLYALGLVEDVPHTLERKTLKRDLLVTNNADFVCNNIEDFFSGDSEKSLISSHDWMYAPIQYINEDSIVTWNGIVINIRNNHRTKKTTIETRDELFAKRKDYIEYESSTWETAASAAKNIMDNYGYTAYDSQTIAASDIRLQNLGAYVQCNFNKSDNLSLFSVIEKLASVCGADAYSHIGNVYFEVWSPYNRSPSISFGDTKVTRIRTAPIVNYLEREVVNDYSIDYDGSGGTPLTDATGGNIGERSRNKFGNRGLEPMETGTGKQIVMKDATSAQAIGEIYINRSQVNLSTNPRPLVTIQFDVDIDFKYYIELGSKFRFTFPDEAWDGKVFEVYEFRRHEDNRNINILAYEVLS
jgi:hypothetical protein